MTTDVLIMAVETSQLLRDHDAQTSMSPSQMTQTGNSHLTRDLNEGNSKSYCFNIDIKNTTARLTSHSLTQLLKHFYVSISC